MNEKVVTYIYHDVTMPDAVMKKLKESNRRLTKINRCLTALSIVSVVYFAITNVRLELQNEQMDDMSRDIEELKKAKGE